METRVVLGHEPPVLVLFGEHPDGIKPNDHLYHPDVREAIRWCLLDSVRTASEPELRDELPRRQWDEIGDIDAAVERTLSQVETPAVRSALPDEASFRCIVNYRGAYAYWDLPSGEPDRTRDLELVEDHADQEEDLPIIDRENDPPTVSVRS